MTNPIGQLFYFIPLRSIWLAAMSMTLMMNAMAKAQIRLFRTQVCFTCCVGLAVKRWREDTSEQQLIKYLRSTYWNLSYILKVTYTTRCDFDLPLQAVLKICDFWHHKWACPPRCVLDRSYPVDCSKRCSSICHTSRWTRPLVIKWATCQKRQIF